MIRTYSWKLDTILGICLKTRTTLEGTSILLVSASFLPEF